MPEPILSPIPRPILRPMILFEDPHLAVLNKPAGLLSQGEATGEPNLVDWLRGRFGRHYVGLVHRLDRNTSGLMVVAKRSKSAQRLTDALQKGELQRSYLAWILGDLAKEERWEHLLLKDQRTNQVRVMPASSKQGQRAILRVRPKARGLWRDISLTLAEFDLETGRSHQIRVQAAAQGHPLLGDSKYGSPGPALQFGRPALHSSRMSFPHPMSKELLRFEAPLPADMAAIRPF